MIRINFLKPLRPQVIANTLVDAGNKRNKLILVGGALAVVALGVVALLQYPTLLGGMLKKPEVVEATPVSEKHKLVTLDTLRPKRVTADAVEETVRDIGDQRDRQAEPPAYADLAASEKIEFQYFVCSRILRDIKAVTPIEVGFANFIFTPPGDFYVHGLTSDSESYERFKTGLNGMQNTAVRVGLFVPAGNHGAGKEFSFYGTIKYPLSAIPVTPDHMIASGNIQTELNQLKSVALGLGIKLKEPKLSSSVKVGVKTRVVYQTSADCSFQQMQDLFTELKAAKSNLGFIRFALLAKSDEKVVAEMDVIAFVN
jgi:hypothetical protein